MELNKEQLERILSWYDELDPGNTAEEDFLPDAILARKLMIEAKVDDKFIEMQNNYIKDLLSEVIDEMKKGDLNE